MLLLRCPPCVLSACVPESKADQAMICEQGRRAAFGFLGAGENASKGKTPKGKHDATGSAFRIPHSAFRSPLLYLCFDSLSVSLLCLSQTSHKVVLFPASTVFKFGHFLVVPAFSHRFKLIPSPIPFQQPAKSARSTLVPVPALSVLFTAAGSLI